MFRSLLLFGLMSSLIAAGQTAGGQPGGAGGMTSGQTVGVVPVSPGSYGGLVVNSGYVTSGSPYLQYMQSGAVNAPLLSPPNVSLPGSGPATGAPPNMNVNDPRLGGTGDVVFPGVGAVSPAENGSVPAPPAPAAARGDVVRNGILNTGLGKFVGNPAVVSASAAQPQMTVADVARQFRARRGVDQPKQFDNARIEALESNTARNNATLVPQATSNVPAATEANQPASQPTTAVLDQRDLATVEAELARSRAEAANSAVQVNPAPSTQQQAAENTTIAQATPPQSANPAATTPQAPQSGANAQPETQNKQQLPASASPLPILGLFGLVAAGVGAVFAFKSRSA